MNAPQHSSGIAALVDPEQHPSALERAAISALAAGDLASAHRLADRRCRILPTAQARHYTLRAEIAHRRGFPGHALADISTALKLAPDDRAANRRMMQWGEDKDRTEAARRLIGIDRDFAVLSAAVVVLNSSDEPAVGALRRVGESIAGWVAWKGRGHPRLQIERHGHTLSQPIESDPQHPLSDAAEHAASFNVPLVQGTTRSLVRLLLGRREIARRVFPAPPGWLRPKDIAARYAGEADHVTIIVPVYDGFDATRRCLDSLVGAVDKDATARVILVDDATPDPRIAALLDSLASHARIKLLRNAENLGFIGAVNRALQTISGDDVILLNADTDVPKDFVARLRAVAHASADIGTVTPLSNNGEGTSLPVAFTVNPLPSLQEIARLDSVAASANRGRVIDMPDGIGFCLYITRACLEAVGQLSDHYHRGYLEDVDLCLRAREHGFRNVCATSVYVGHAGSVSFKAEKRALVVLNLDRLRLRFPDYRQESAAFKSLDPLRPARAAIERSLPADSTGAVLIVTGPGAPAQVAAQFAKASGQRALIATLTGATLSLRDAAGGFPQSLRFVLPAEAAALAEIARGLAFSRVVVVDPARVPVETVRDLTTKDLPTPGIPLDLLIADGGLWCQHGGLNRDHRPCPALTAGKACDCRGILNGTADLSGTPDRWLAELTSGSRLIAPDPMAEALLRRRLPAAHARRVTLMDTSDVFGDLQRPKTVAPRGDSFGLLAVGHAPADFALIQHLARRLRQMRPRMPIVVFGETLDDLALMALGNLAVTGAVGAGELGDLARHYALGGLVIARRAPLFGHPLIAAAFHDVDVPLAFVDWSFGHAQIAAVDCRIAPARNEGSIVAELLAWIAKW